MKKHISDLRKIIAGYTVSFDKIDAATERVLKHIKAIMKKKGYDYGVQKSSASIEWTWDNGSFNLSIHGWHGKGDWGGGMMFHDVFIGMKKIPVFVMPGMKISDPGSGMPSRHDGLNTQEVDRYMKGIKTLVKLVDSL